MHKKKVTLRVAEQIQPATARVAELADALDLGSSAERRAGSTPASRTQLLSKSPMGRIIRSSSLNAPRLLLLRLFYQPAYRQHLALCS